MLGAFLGRSAWQDFELSSKMFQNFYVKFVTKKLLIECCKEEFHRHFKGMFFLDFAKNLPKVHCWQLRLIKILLHHPLMMVILLKVFSQVRNC